MKKIKMFGIIALTAAFILSTSACSIKSGEKIVNNAEELKAYLDSRPANSAEKPIKVAMNAKDIEFDEISNAITSSGKYVSLNLSGSPITAIPNMAFYDEEEEKGCITLVSLIIPNSVTSIGEGAFLECTGLTGITITNSVTDIGALAFANCTGLTKITIPDSVTVIGGGAFARCINLASIKIGNGVTNINSFPVYYSSVGAFFGCTSLTSITIPKSVTGIGEDAFYGCTGLTAINVDSGNKNYSSDKGVLYNKDKTELIAYPQGKAGAFTIPNSVTSIGTRAFKSCTALNSVTIGNKVESIGNSAFQSCTNLTSITIPDSVTSIGEGAFLECTGLTSVTFQGTISSDNLGGNRFPGDLRIKYLAGGIGTYKTTAPVDWDSSVWTKN